MTEFIAPARLAPNPEANLESPPSIKLTVVRLPYAGGDEIGELLCQIGDAEPIPHGLFPRHFYFMRSLVEAAIEDERSGKSFRRGLRPRSYLADRYAEMRGTHVEVGVMGNYAKEMRDLIGAFLPRAFRAAGRDVPARLPNPIRTVRGAGYQLSEAITWAFVDDGASPSRRTQPFDVPPPPA